MAKALDALKALNAYPIPATVITTAAVERGLDANSEATQEVMQSKEYRLCKADIYMWLAGAPNISQGGQNYSFSEEQRQNFRNIATEIYGECEETAAKARYGYKGHRL